jgi:hypothetical protein
MYPGGKKKKKDGESHNSAPLFMLVWRMSH